MLINVGYNWEILSVTQKIIILIIKTQLTQVPFPSETSDYPTYKRKMKILIEQHFFFLHDNYHSFPSICYLQNYLLVRDCSINFHWLLHKSLLNFRISTCFFFPASKFTVEWNTNLKTLSISIDIIYRRCHCHIVY